MQLSWLGLPVATLVQVLLVLTGARATRDATRNRNVEKIWIWRHAKVPGKYTAKMNLDVTMTPNGVALPRDFSKVAPMKLTNPGKWVLIAGTPVDIVEVRIVNHEYIWGRLSDEFSGGWITMGWLANKKTHEVRDYVARVYDGDERQLSTSVSTGRRAPRRQPSQAFLDAEGYKLRPSTGGWKYGFKEATNLGRVIWTIDGLSQGCEDATLGDRATVEMDRVATEKVSRVWSMVSYRPFVLQGCSVLQGKRPAGLNLTMHWQTYLPAWEGSVSIEPRNLCSQDAHFQHGSGDLKYPEGKVFIPIRSSQPWSNTEDSRWDLPVALWILSYKCFSIQSTGFHRQRGDWNSWEVHLQILETTFHLLREEGCATLPFGC